MRIEGISVYSTLSSRIERTKDQDETQEKCRDKLLKEELPGVTLVQTRF